MQRGRLAALNDGTYAATSAKQANLQEVVAERRQEGVVTGFQEKWAQEVPGCATDRDKRQRATRVGVIIITSTLLIPIYDNAHWVLL